MTWGHYRGSGECAVTSDEERKDFTTENTESTEEEGSLASLRMTGLWRMIGRLDTGENPHPLQKPRRVRHPAPAMFRYRTALMRRKLADLKFGHYTGKSTEWVDSVAGRDAGATKKEKQKDAERSEGGAGAPA
jgi:hypothetical protein